MTAASFASKPLGYVRVLIIAWAFGTSAGMDAFYLASGIAMLFVTSFTTAMESAVLPELALLQANEGEESVKNLMAIVFWTLLVLTAFFVAGLFFFSEGLVRFFARGFDPERLRMGGQMLLWLLPFSIASALRAPLDIWATHRQQYTLPSLCALIFNVIAIPSLLLFIPIIGVYSVALCMGIGTVASTLLLWFVLDDLPLKFSFIPWKSLKQVGNNTVLCIAVVGSSGLYIMVDRYFASLLPVGSVSAISYASYIFGLLTALVSPPLFIFLAKASALMAEDPNAAEAYLHKALAVGFSYFTPLGLFVAALSYPLVVLSLGWGAFGQLSVDATSIALAAYCIGLPFAVLSIVLYRFAQAQQRLAVVVFMTYILIGVNALLNWFFSKWWGVGGLALATTCVQFFSFLYLSVIFIKKPLAIFKGWTAIVQILFSALCASIMWGLSLYFGDIVSLVISVFLCFGYFYISDRLCLFEALPENWRPIYLFKSLSDKLRNTKYNGS